MISIKEKQKLFHALLNHVMNQKFNIFVNEFVICSQYDQKRQTTARQNKINEAYFAFILALLCGTVNAVNVNVTFTLELTDNQFEKKSLNVNTFPIQTR